ncbi:hypothetical protein [Salisediminibacterium halotolerans]|uniref:hypothetical protein n=1 Tax=Salisediminibacterium halotolerans TaxID=517425 RepID=UPI000EB103DC|nr:hypothetical protein [Salisediminibacterium halotolerans]RLJ78267.1 hypothetical protein BCL39_0738 [Actinophytocola xinjiangensis]RPE88394.1 hypothetical protein EDD67_0721 [Salisediminibacterium halotolerans]TWG37244.1 hypothetical protein BCL52_0737 [Salisediminibacterium halotolerans]GEL07724.1 hypothetical protein SHA02_11400 [Salisediminibacterium halotolerans]
MLGLIILLTVMFIVIGGGLTGWYIVVESEGDAFDAVDTYGETVLSWAVDFVIILFVIGLIYLIFRVTRRMNRQ